MDAHDTQIFKYLEGSKSFVIPLFQRTYSWDNKHLETLWADLTNTMEEKETTHFFGSFVTMPEPSSASGISKYIVIDGQQRLVTTTIFLAALRKRAEDIDKSSELKNSIFEQYLTNKYAELSLDKNKVIPTQADREILSTVVNKPDTLTDKEHKIAKAYYYFKGKLDAEIQDIDQIKKIKNTLLNKFSIVDICLDKDDDPYLIFESLNAKGEPLTQADLVRNYLFMKISPNNQQEIYDTIWLPMQQRLNSSAVDFLRHYLARNGKLPNYNKVYSSVKAFSEGNFKDEKQVIEYATDLSKYSEYYYRFINPEAEKDPEIRAYFASLNYLDVTTSYPLLLNLYNDLFMKKISKDEFVGFLSVLESYIIRRAVCGVPTNFLNRFFPTVYQKLDKTDIITSFKQVLSTETEAGRMPDDLEFSEHLRIKELYGTKTIGYLLMRIELKDNKETVNFEDLQIEHIMPQTLSDPWKNELGEDWELTYKKYLHSLGNLTLTGYNAEYSNRPFIEKRDMSKGFKDSGLRLNREIAQLDRWTEKEIIQRGERLAKIALQLWPL
jgi:uncharacterized protein with ParB-like and HNH nuclease domain